MKGYGVYHLVKSPTKKYCYDGNKGKLFEIDEDVYSYLNDAGEWNDEVGQKIKQIRAQGFLLDEYPTKIEHGETKNIEYHLTCKVSSIILQLTQECNFRCTYCIYSEDSSPYQRTHSSLEMTEEQAERAVDFLFENSRDVRLVNIGFYGGEPLLRFDLIRHIVDYVNENYYGKKVTYAITTNGSLLTDEVINFFIEHNIRPMISFDGPKEIHDKYRHFAHNGKGTYDAVISRLDYIKNYYPEFFKKLKFLLPIYYQRHTQSPSSSSAISTP